MKDQTKMMVKALGVSIVVMVVLICIFFTQYKPAAEAPLEAKIFLGTLVCVLWVWFCLTHRDENGAPNFRIW